MSAFSPSDAAFEGFRVTREKPLAVLAWAGLFASTIILAAVLIVAGFAPRLEGAADFNAEDPAAVMAMLGKLAPVLIALMTVWVILSGVINAAIYRRVLEPADSRGAYLRLGRDEWRQVGALFLCLFAAMAFSLGVTLVLALPMRLLEAVGLGRFGLFLGNVVALGLQIWFGLRLSLVPALTFAAKRIDVPAAWRLTQGQLVRLLSMFVLSVVFALVVWLLISVVSTALAVLMAGGDMSVMAQLQNPQPGLSGAATGAVLVYFLISLLTPVLLMVIIQAPTAVAYRALSAAEPAGAGDI
jgi:hypothetical protein